MAQAAILHTSFGRMEEADVQFVSANSAPADTNPGELGGAGCSNPECPKSEHNLRCARCGSVGYCSKACQRAHWSTHRSGCSSISGGSDAGVKDARALEPGLVAPPPPPPAPSVDRPSRWAYEPESFPEFGRREYVTGGMLAMFKALAGTPRAEDRCYLEVVEANRPCRNMYVVLGGDRSIPAIRDADIAAIALEVDAAVTTVLRSFMQRLAASDGRPRSITMLTLDASTAETLHVRVLGAVSGASFANNHRVIRDLVGTVSASLYKLELNRTRLDAWRAAHASDTVLSNVKLTTVMDHLLVSYLRRLPASRAEGLFYEYRVMVNYGGGHLVDRGFTVASLLDETVYAKGQELLVLGARSRGKQNTVTSFFARSAHNAVAVSAAVGAVGAVGAEDSGALEIERLIEVDADSSSAYIMDSQMRMFAAFAACLVQPTSMEAATTIDSLT